MLHEQMDTLPVFDSHTADPFVLFIEPPSLDARIVNQSGLFSVMSDPALCMDRWFPEGEHICRKVIGSCKSEPTSSGFTYCRSKSFYYICFHIY